MTPPNSELKPKANYSVSLGASAPVAAAPRALGSSVSADLEALKNDVEQARQLACDYQQQLAGKTNDHADLKALFEKTRDDLLHLQKGVAQLREERHQFANDAMKAAALQLKLERMTRERDQLQNEVQALRSVRASEADERVVQLTREVERLRRDLRFGDSSAEAPAPTPKVSRPAETIAVGFGDEDWDEATITILPTDPGTKARRWKG